MIPVVTQCMEPTEHVQELGWQEHRDRLIVVSHAVIVPRCDIVSKRFPVDQLRQLKPARSQYLPYGVGPLAGVGRSVDLLPISLHDVAASFPHPSFAHAVALVVVEHILTEAHLTEVHVLGECIERTSSTCDVHRACEVIL